MGFKNKSSRSNKTGPTFSENRTYIYIYIWRCDGPERHEMLTVINAYYGYYGILQVCWILH